MTPLERAARALAKRDGADPDHVPGTDGRAVWRLYEPLVRTVVAAIREPSAAMCAAWVGNSPGGSTPSRDWQAMIDALLVEGREGLQGDRPISWQIDQLIAKAKEDGRRIVRIRAAKPFAENLAAEMGGMLRYSAPGLPEIVYNGVLIETEDRAETGWLAYDQNGLVVPR